MNKIQFNKVTSALGKYIPEIIDNYYISISYDGSQYDTHGKCVDREWCVSLEALPALDGCQVDQYRLSGWFDEIEGVLKIWCPDVEIYPINNGDYRYIEIV